MSESAVPIRIDALLADFEHAYRATVETRLRPDSARGLPSQVGHALRDFLLGGGKRLRPLLLMLGYLGYREAGTQEEMEAKVLPACVGIELLHHFVLIHDDVVDRSCMRHNRPALHVILGDYVNDAEAGRDMACIAGDYLYTLALEIILEARADSDCIREALRILLDAGVRTGAGALLELWWRKSTPVVGLQEARGILQRKTAYYSTAAPLQIGALLAGASPSEIDGLHETGVKLGLAYQIHDDLDDLSACLRQDGEVHSEQWRELCCTYPISALHANLQASDREAFDKAIAAGAEDLSARRLIAQLLHKDQTLHRCAREAADTAQEGMAHLGSLAMSLSVRACLIDVIHHRFLKDLFSVEPR